MARIKPFAALLPKPELASRICELPYDVMSSEEARRLASSNPLSFLHVSKPEIDLPPGTPVYSAPVYAKGRENFERLREDGALFQDGRACFYFYRQIMGGHRQTGLVAVASCEDYLEGRIKKHELTRPDKEADRMRHIEALEAQTGPVFLCYRAGPVLDEVTAQATASAPFIDFTARDGVRHSAWRVADAEMIQAIEAEFAALSALYIADGHHRSAAAARVFQQRHGSGQSAFFLSVIFPHDRLQILPYNRAVKDLKGQAPAELLKKLESIFTIGRSGQPIPSRKHQLSLYLHGRWQTLEFRGELVSGTDPIGRLDVSLLQKWVLGPVFGIDDPRTSRRIQFVGGIRGVAELENLVRSGEAACAFSMFPTSLDDLMTVADGGETLPPKSTWFEPKLRDAMFCHLI